MHELSPTELLEVWERGLTLPHEERALILLGAAFPGPCDPPLERRSIGQRNALLLDLRERLFGPRLVALATCPRCGELLELDFETSQIRASSAGDVEPLSVEACGYQVRCRLPNSVDLAQVRGCREVDVVERKLLSHCLLSARQDGVEATVDQLPDEVLGKIAQALEQADAQANIQLSLSCQDCRHHWLASLDIVAYLWSELDIWARRILREVHCLASAHGWSERDILNMQPWRRQIYMEMIGG